MGRRGPPPKPTTLKILAGNPGKRPLNKSEPRPPAVTPQCPAWLSREAKAEWKRIVPVLAEMKLLTLVDRAALTAYCEAWADLVVTTKLIEKEGRIIIQPIYARDSGEEVGSRQLVHPAVKMKSDAFLKVKAFLSEFGLSPASRSRLTAPKKEVDESDPIEELIRRGKPSKAV